MVIKFVIPEQSSYFGGNQFDRVLYLRVLSIHEKEGIKIYILDLPEIFLRDAIETDGEIKSWYYSDTSKLEFSWEQYDSEGNYFTEACVNVSDIQFSQDFPLPL